eukprot:TRINITY_DN8735_c0_g1_i3.p1 TRINITY_DN8735_c0_g1~~TRINITY_DN8735_c0_g1_i3.p1  ORF type:complete len:159 (-),score=11.85 TRINITY_DN8735_c0_g1_i3:286-762(-)
MISFAQHPSLRSRFTGASNVCRSCRVASKPAPTTNMLPMSMVTVPVMVAMSVFIIIAIFVHLNLLAAQLDGAYLAIYNDIGGYFDYKPVYSPALERGHDSEAQQIATFLGAFIYLGRMGQLFINQARRLASECETKRLCPWGASEFPSICLICRTKSQ